MKVRIHILMFFISFFSWQSFASKPIKDNPSPDYSDMKSWAAHPNIQGPSDMVPAFLNGEKRDTSVDVFFIYPTTYIAYNANYGLNASISDAAINKKTDEGTIQYQASVFNGDCRIFAPRYRQANLKVFFAMRDKPEAKQSLDLAYEDVKKAFQYYLDHWNHGRPIIIASHSQGTVHAIRLLQDFFDGKPLQKQLVCAYLVGYQIKKDAFKAIPVGTTATQTGCFVGWRSFKNGFYPKRRDSEPGNSQCVNPVTWDTTHEWSPKVLHRGILGRNFNKLLFPRSTSCQIEPSLKILWVEPPKRLKKKYSVVSNYHVFDYNLFYMNIRHNVRQRVEAYMNKK